MKLDSEERFIMLNKCCYFELSNLQRILEFFYYGFHKIIKQHNCFQH